MQVEAGDFTAYPAGSEAHGLRNNEFNILQSTIVGQRLDFNIADYSEQARRLDHANGIKGNLADVAMIVPLDNQPPITSRQSHAANLG